MAPSIPAHQAPTETCLVRGSEGQEPPLSLWSISPIFDCKLERAAWWCISCYPARVTAKACVTPLVLWKHAFVRGEACWAPLRTMAHLAVTDSLEYLVSIKAWSQVSDALSKYIYGVLTSKAVWTVRKMSSEPDHPLASFVFVICKRFFSQEDLAVYITSSFYVEFKAYYKESIKI